MQLPTTIKECHELLQEQQRLIMELKAMMVSMSLCVKDLVNQLNQNSYNSNLPHSDDRYRNKPVLGTDPKGSRGGKLNHSENTLKMNDTVDHRQKSYPLLYGGYPLSHQSIQELFHNLYGHELNEATIQAATQNLHVKLRTSELHLRQLVCQRPVVHFDETGQRVAGKLNWLHEASTENLTYLFAHPYRGSKAQESSESVLSSYMGTAVHDCLPVYLTNMISFHRTAALPTSLPESTI